MEGLRQADVPRHGSANAARESNRPDGKSDRDAARAGRDLNRNATSGPHDSRQSDQARQQEQGRRPEQARQPEQTRRQDVIGSRPAPGGNAAERQQPPAAGSQETVGRAASRPDEGRDGRFDRDRQLEQGRLDRRNRELQRAPILRNPVFADQRMSRRGREETPSQLTFRGRFSQSALHDDRPRHHHHRRSGIVLGFVGPLFWPYAYSDFVNYTFSPYAYDTFWPYAFDDVYTGIYGGYAPEYRVAEDAYAYAGSPASERIYVRAANTPGGGARPSQSAERICSGEAKGVTDFAIQKIADQTSPDQNQQALLDELKAASVKAVDIMQNACPSELSSTPTDRLAAMRSRVDAMLRAVEVIRPALDKFYDSLSDEQRERFIAVDQGQQEVKGQRGADLNHLCQGDLAAKSGVPVDKIQRTLRLNPDQETSLKALDEATTESAKMLQAKCQPDESLTPPGRLAAMEERLQVMLKALDTTQAALSKFYGSLNGEQKARFDRMSVRAS